MNNQKEIIKKEIDLLIEDIKKAYEDSGKKVTGTFPEGIEVKYTKNKAEVFGFTYLAGRASGKMPPVESIKKWVIEKGIFEINEFLKASSLAWAIAKTIAKKGTNKEYELKIYEKVITPQRIDSIIKKVSSFNVNIFVEELTTSLQVLKNV